ncbi:hypothetical protein GCM10010216_64910 [Streptomyces flaveolus]|nr:hypothetical protein GCM10010216_64910 [Streptomyces flaveolus]
MQQGPQSADDVAGTVRERDATHGIAGSRLSHDPSLRWGALQVPLPGLDHAVSEPYGGTVRSAGASGGSKVTKVNRLGRKSVLVA